MSRSMVLVFLLLILIITSQFEWNQQVASETEDNSTTSNNKHQQSSNREEVIKEKIILSQERSIQKLNELVRRLQEELQQCRGNNNTKKGDVQQLPTETVDGRQSQLIFD